ncbi:MAG: S41 family peptidase [Polyangiales bacterium]
MHRVRLALGCLLASFTGGALVAHLAQADKRDDSPHAAIEQLAKVLVQIENRYVDPVDRAKLLQGAIKGMVAELDPHSEYFPPKEFAEFNSETEGKFGGVGIEFQGGGEWLTVIAPIEGSPAEAAGIHPGDQVIAIDGKEARPLEKAARAIRGDPGTKIELTIRRPSENGKLYRVPLVRAEIHLPSVDWALLPGGVAWLRVRAFQDKSHDELVDAIGKVRAKAGGKLAGVVLDLRRDPGGLVDQAVDIADEFMDKGVVFSMRGQGGKLLEETKATSGGALVGLPTAVLVDEGSASAAELVAGALQDGIHAVVVGMPTFGKGIVQTVIELPGGAGLKLTTARYYTPNGHSIQAQGVEPDVKVESTRVVDAPAVPFPKEKDYENAIAAEGPLKGDAGSPIPLLAPAASATTVTVAAPNGGTTTITTNANGANGDAGVPPAGFPGKKPDLEHDFQLRMAHQIVTGVLGKK